MSGRLSKLLNSYEQHISIPWPVEVSPQERTIFIVYNKEDELKLRARVVEFEDTTRKNNHDWILLDITHGFEDWMAEQDYKETYFEDPNYLEGLYGDFSNDIAEKLKRDIKDQQSNDSVVAILGCGTLFGFASVSGLVEEITKVVAGRLVVFFPGEYQNNNYKLLDAKDGWGYHATAITAMT